MSLEPTFALTPRNSSFFVSEQEYAKIVVFGPYFGENGLLNSFDYSCQHDWLFFSEFLAADPKLDYTKWHNLRGNGFIALHYDLRATGSDKELALVFGFDAFSNGRILVYSDAEQLGDVTLEQGDNQFLMEVEDLGPMSLFFVHANKAGGYGGDWFFVGLTGYVI